MLLKRALQTRRMRKPCWSITFEAHPPPDGHERLVRALHLVFESTPCAPPRVNRASPLARDEPRPQSEGDTEQRNQEGNR